MAEYPCCGPMFWLYVVICCGLVAFAGIMSGLTLGLMSLSIVDLEVLVKAGKPQDQKYAAKILPVVKNHHLLLCTLLIGNALAMEALPIFLDKLVPSWGAILISVTLILAFGEIIPQSVCTRYGLKVGAKMAPFVHVLVIIIFPIAYPISKLLDLILGKDHVMLMRRSELKTLVDMHGNEAGKGGELTHDETTIISGALDLTQKTAEDAMTPIVETFSLDINAKLDMETMGLIMRKGHSRVPIYSGSPTNIIGLILVKNLITCRPEDEIPIRNVTIRTIPRVYDDLPLYDILNEFQKGHSHMAVVVKRSKLAVGATENNIQSNRSGNHTPVNGNGMINPGNSPLGSSRSNININNIHGGDATRQQQMRRGGRQSKNILDISNTDALPSYNLDEEVVGIITMEDVMEELLQEEILDETDEYVDVHNKIHINMLPPKKLSARSSGTTPLSQLIRKSPSASPFSPNHTITNNNDNSNNNTNSNILHSPPSRTFTLKKSLPSSPARNSPSLSLSGQSSPLTQKVSKKPYEKLQKSGDPS